MVRGDVGWTLVGTHLTRFGLFLASERAAADRDEIVRRHPALADALSHERVLNGPFEDLDYTGVASCCSAHYPKLLGTYEAELHPFLNALSERDFDGVINVGSAEGYYAVGLATRFPSWRVVAYDADEKARSQIKRLAIQNGVADRIEIRGRCGPSDLGNLPFRRALVVMDCEGAEETLLRADNIRRLAQSTLIIETHDGYLPGITRRIADLLAGSHVVHVVDAVHDADRSEKLGQPDVLHELSRREANCVMAENRIHACLRWLVAQPKRV